MEVKCFGSHLTTEFSAQHMLAAITFIIVAVVLGPSPANLLFFTHAFKEALLLKFALHGILFPSFPPSFYPQKVSPPNSSSAIASMSAALSPPCVSSPSFTFLEPSVSATHMVLTCTLHVAQVSEPPSSIWQSLLLSH